MNVTEIAEAVGYQTPKYFNKVFREFEETTPGAYRKSM
ncbi:AraC family transcriptional regulator [Halolactibacillus sp. JCM 19043]|nr:helix-turn-helix domain-containing protein [Halolactibacillus sp. JCM 19043]